MATSNNSEFNKGVAAAVAALRATAADYTEMAGRLTEIKNRTRQEEMSLEVYRISATLLRGQAANIHTELTKK